jgi:hypothetical protein
MARPPSSVGASQVKSTEVGPLEVVVIFRGFDAGMAVVPDTDGDQSLVPSTLIAAT